MQQINGWIDVFTSPTEQIATLVRGYLNDFEIPAQVFSKRDQMLHLVMSEHFTVYVPLEHQERAMALILSFESESQDQGDNG
ncbi:MAG: hypothetical protein SFU91_07510 [Chloroherpetonaceae bacterium]|nr:hypothetical protein [Chloroherpetonaceae bacterium]